MNFADYKTFDLQKRRPKVLLIGNGLTYSTGVPWHELIKKTARPGADVTKYEQLDKDGRHQRFYVPNTVLMLAVSEVGDVRRHKQYVEVLKQDSYPENERLKELLQMPFDAVLTTNYTYEPEAALLPKYPGLGIQSKRRYAHVTKDKRDPKYLLHTFNRIEEGKPDIWHIHGELRCPSSLILSHDEYARLVHAILAYNESVGNGYQKNQSNLRFKSWIDYLILGDVYILGLGMDYSEFDLWWLLGRRLREGAACGSIVFYEPYKEGDKYKQLALEDAGVEVNTCGVTIQSGGDYGIFYERAIQDIGAKVAS